MNPRTRREQGFTVIELLIALLIAVEVLVAASVIFDVHSRMAVVQTQITDMQQSLRIAHFDINRLVRMAGRGGLPATFLVDLGPPARLRGTALDVRNHVLESDDSNQVALGRDQPRAVPGSDILTLRGCISSPLYQIAGTAADFTTPTATTASLTISNPSPLGIPQCLRPMAEQISARAEDGPGLAGQSMILGSPQDRSRFYVGKIVGQPTTSGDPLDCSPTASPSTMKFTLDLQPNVFSPAAFDPAMGVALVCQLEEYRYYVREAERAVGPASIAIDQPRLSRARMTPGTETPHLNRSENLELDIADGVFDLQVAFGFDSDYPSTASSERGAFGDDLDNLGVDDTIFEGDPGDGGVRAADDWLFNTPGDRPAD
ncbi:MAG: hypothetical protein K8H90_02130, partial [Thermoanaerobaculia bacterium]|nr:hypothetical protein [Thermoanaerobaculia bacterium]